MDKSALFSVGFKTPSCLIPTIIVAAGIIYGFYHLLTCDDVVPGIFQTLLIVIGAIALAIIMTNILSSNNSNSSKREEPVKTQNSSRSITKELTRDILGNLVVDGKAINTAYSSSIIRQEPIENEIGKMIVRQSPINEIDDYLIKRESSQSVRSTIVSKAINYAMGKLGDSEEVTLENENYIEDLRKRFYIGEGELQRLPNYIGYMKFLQIQDLLQGNIPKRFYILVSPINLQKSETPIWEFENATLYEEQTTRTMVGSSSGFSVRIAKGIYYRAGAFKGRPVVTTNLVPKYYGAMVITNKHIYFYSREKAVRFSFTKIVSFVNFEDGIGIQLDKQNSKPILIKNIDGWLAYNIATNIQYIN